ncbi:DUF6385 domain-containing protein [Paenibacillus sp. FSL K6-1566]|jgi:hypothetical protein|uniref:DUF6385 domain-containing protein n=1 Tax=Paenibacillus TaxID=44249 RepID=UPI0020409381|nr:DUF6385 domain-containing protein [Paenibacillus lactis]MCM3494622.1 DUF6385 domain-containing protein [Paenibacillus lactis]
MPKSDVRKKCANRAHRQCLRHQKLTCRNKQRPARRGCKKNKHTSVSIRRLKACRDSVLVYGSDKKRCIHPVLVDRKGRILVRLIQPIPSRIFRERKFTDIEVQPEWTFLPSQETARQITYSYAVINLSDTPVSVRVEIGPDREHYTTDREETVPPGQTIVMVPTRFLRFTRVALLSQDQDKTVRVDVYYQAQSSA